MHEGKRKKDVVWEIISEAEYWIFSVLIGIEVLCLATGCDIGYVTLKCMVIDRLLTRKGRRSDLSHHYGIMPIVIFNFLTSVERLW